jgi:hypothetical protein
VSGGTGFGADEPPRLPGALRRDVIVLDRVLLGGATLAEKDTHAVGDDVGAVVGFAVAFEAALADAPGDMDEVAGRELVGAFLGAAEERDTVPVGVILPPVAVLAG